MFACGDNRRFRTPQGMRGGSKLVVDGEIITDSKLLLKHWVTHFSQLAESRRDFPGLEELQSKVDQAALDRDLSQASRDPLDFPFSSEEMERESPS